MKIEDVLKDLRKEMTIILTNLVQQARRLADRTMFMLNGEVVEIGDTEPMFSGNAKQPKTNAFVSGDLGDPTMSAQREHAIVTEDLSLWYGFQALDGVSTAFEMVITGLIGPSGCGKTTFLRCLNRVNERYGNVRTEGMIDILAKIFTTMTYRLSSCASPWAWSFSGPIRCRFPYTKTSCSACGSTSSAAN